VNFVTQRFEIDAVSFERPRPIGQNSNPYAGRHRAANGFNRQCTEDDVGYVRRTLPISYGRAFRLINGQHRKWLTGIGQPDAGLTTAGLQRLVPWSRIAP